MAKRSATDGESASAYFRTIFKEDPKLLRSGSNQGIVERWLRDHPGDKKMPQKAKYAMYNMKSLIRKKRKTRKSLVEGDPSKSTVLAFRVSASKKGLNALVQLEESIDGCLSTARTLDRDTLADVIQHLRTARNAVVGKLGQ